jgi:RND superfamily putative drug exporter
VPVRLLSAAAGRRGKWLVAASWVLLVIAGSVAASHFQGAQNNDQSSYLPGSAESSKVLAQVKRLEGGNVVTAAVVVFARARALRADDFAVIATDGRRLDAELPRRTVPAGPPLRSRDGRAALLIFGLRLHDSTAALDAAVGTIRRVVHRGVPRGLQVAVSGPAGSSYDAERTFSKLGGTLLTVTVALIFVLLLIIYRSPIFWLIPLLSVAAAEVCAEALGYLLTRVGVTVNAEAAGILTVLVFGAGTDYALLLVSRYREELQRHHDHHDALRAALHRGGPVVLASAATVILALLCLLAAEVNGTRGLGPVAASGVAVTLVSALTLLPALLAICGRRIFWPFVPRLAEPGGVLTAPSAGSAQPGGETSGARGWRMIADRLTRRHRLVAVLVTLALGAACFGVLGLNGGLTSGNSFRGRVEAVTGQRLIAAHYPAGTSEPAQVIVPAQRDLAPVIAAVARTAGVRPGAVSVQRGRPASVLTVTLAANPSSPAAFQRIPPIRAAARRAGGPGTLVGGATAQEVDLRSAATRDTVVVAPMILFVVFVVLGLLLRSLVAPTLLIATVVLSFGAALGAGVLVFAHAFGYPGEDPSMPLFAFLFLVALGVDYNIFLMARVREEALAVGTRAGVIRALVSTGPVITSAGIVLAGTFAALASLPLIGFTELGVVIALGVLLDTLLVRTVLVPALVLELDRRIWWPAALARPAEQPAPAGGDRLSASSSRDGMLSVP